MPIHETKTRESHEIFELKLIQNINFKIYLKLKKALINT